MHGIPSVKMLERKLKKKLGKTKAHKITGPIVCVHFVLFMQLQPTGAQLIVFVIPAREPLRIRIFFL